MRKGFGVIGIIFFLIVLAGAGFLFYKTHNQGLSEKEFQFNGQQYSILLPKNHLTKTAEKGVVSAGKGDVFASIISFFPTSSNKEVSCSDIKAQKAFVVYNQNFKKDIEVCSTTSTEKGVEIVMLDSPSLNDEKYRYTVGIGTTKKYFETETGKSNLEKIFASFKVK